MIIRLSSKTLDIQLYRDSGKDYDNFLDKYLELELPETKQPYLCSVCQGILQKCDDDQVVNSIVS